MNIIKSDLGSHLPYTLNTPNDKEIGEDDNVVVLDMAIRTGW